MKKLLPVLFIVTMLIVILTGCNEDAVFGAELVVNGDFEEDFTSWKKQNGSQAIIEIATTTEGSDQEQEGPRYGLKQLDLSSGFSANWLYVTQEIPVVKNAVYRLQADISVADNLESESFSAVQVGAYVGFKEDKGIKRINVTEKTDGWQTYIVYFRPVADSALNIEVGIGTSKSLSKGKARFDNVSVQRVEKQPGGYEVYDVGVKTNINRSNTGGTVYVVLLSVMTAVISWAAYMLIRRFMAKYAGDTGLNKKASPIINFTNSPVFLMSAALLTGFIIRLILINFIYGHTADISRFQDWASRLYDKGAWAFYSDVDTAFMPGYLYVLWLLGAFSNLLGIQSGTVGMAIFLKIPAIVCDIIIIYLIFNIALKHFNKYIATVFAAFYAILPVVFTNSAAWGQIDSVYGLFILLTFISLLDKKYVSAIIFYTIAIFINAEVLLLLPLILSYLIFVFVRNPETRLKLSVASAAALVSIVILSLPFTVKLGGANVVFYSFGRMIASLFGNSVYSSNAFNFYGIFGLNMESASLFARVLSWLIYIVVALYVCLIYFNKKNRAELLLLASFVLSAAYVFIIGATPQTMFTAFALMLAYMAISGDKRVLLVFSALALTNFINISQLLNQSGSIGLSGSAQIISYPDASAFMIVGGIVNVLILFYYAIIVYDICYSDDVRELEPMQDSIFKTIKDYLKGVKSIFVPNKTGK